ncbi:MAG: carboxypeptidase regulatory-like domain-containing protein [Planctomycetes bacterium]|nr:carboxypeptidase regulatory-like domain-containing protein [Planctomycetota bacterium]
MHRIALGCAVWSALLLAIAGLAALARPASGPPMPRGAAARAAFEALVPEREVRPEAPRRAPRPEALSGTVAPRSAEDDSAAQPGPPPRAEPDGEAGPGAHGAAATDVSPQGGQPPRPEREVSVPGLGVLPAGVPAEEEGFGLHVVRADGRPVVDAVVRWMLQKDLDAVRARLGGAADLHPADLLEHAPHTLRTGPGGFAMLTSAAGTMLMDARHGDAYGWAVVRREEQSHRRLVLSRITHLQVRAADGAGAPRAGVPVVLSDARCRPIWRALTDEAGAAVLRFADAAILEAGARFDDLLLAVDVPGGAAVAIPRAQVPAALVELVAPPGRRVLVRVRDVDGAPCSRPTTVRLAPAGREGDCSAERAREAVDGQAVFDQVPGGLELAVRVDSACSPEPLSAALRSRLEGDSEVVLTATARMPRLRARLMDPHGNSWRGFEVVAWARTPGGWLEQGRDRTDDTGAFELDVPVLHRAPAVVELVLVARNPWGRTVASTGRLATAAGDGLRDFGHVTAADWSVLARGVVLDESERPLAHAEVELVDESGVADPRTRIVCDERGGFALRGPAPEGDRLRVRATEPDRRASEAVVSLARGEQRARIVIAVHGRITGRLLLPDGAPESGVIVRVEQPSGAVLALSTDADGDFAFSNVEAGESRITFVPLGFEESLLTLERVVVPRGAAADDPRLSHVDLRALVAVLELEVLDERGAPILTGWVGPPSSDPGRPRGRPYEVVDGLARVVVPRGAAVQVSAQGYEPAVLAAPAGRLRVDLRPSGG